MSVASDVSVSGLLGYTPEPLRYEHVEVDAHEVSGILNAMLPSNARVLDVGCGPGGMTLAANRGKQNTVLAIEPDADRAAEARRRGLDVHHGVLDDAFVASHAPFDAITFADVLEHLIDPPSILALAKRVLAPRGAIIASVPNVAHWSVRAKLAMGRFEYDKWGIMDATHLRWFTRKTLIEMFERQNLKVVESRASLGAFAACYGRGPLGSLPSGSKRRLLAMLSRSAPGLFGFQHVVKAVVA